MITVRIPKEIREYKEKIFWGLTARQLIASIPTLGKLNQFINMY